MDVDTLLWPQSFFRRAGRRVDIYRYRRDQSRCYIMIEGLDPREAPLQTFLATFEMDEKGLFVHLVPLFGAERLVAAVSLHDQIQTTRRETGMISVRGRRTRAAQVSSLPAPVEIGAMVAA